MFMVLSSWLRVIAWVHRLHAMNAEQRQTAADLWRKPMDLSHRPACRLLGNYIHNQTRRWQVEDEEEQEEEEDWAL